MDRDPYPKPHVRRWFAVTAAVCLLLLIPLIVVASPLIFGSNCACSSTPTPHPPGWTPTPLPPVSPSDAAARAAALSGVSMGSSLDWLTISGRPIYQPQGNGAYGFVDGDTGVVVQVVMVNDLPASDAVAISAEAARRAAETVLARGGMTASGMGVQTQLVQRASVAFYDVTWSDAATSKPALEVLVNAASGSFFVYRDGRSSVDVGIPVLGFAAAAKLAGASSYARGETPGAAAPDVSDIQVLPGSEDRHPWAWTVVFPDGVLFVDAATGEVWVGKWSAR